MKSGAMMVELKKALTYEEQLERLKNVHNLIINDSEAAIDILKKVNYYRLSGYGIGLTDRDNRGRYIGGITIEHIYRLYQFDSRFKNLLIHVIEQVEIQLRTQISNFLALKYGAEGYMCADNFLPKQSKDGSLIYDTIIKSFYKERDRQKNVPFVKHHMEKYGGHFPIWVAVELFSFGNLSSLYSIMNSSDQAAVAKLYNTKPKYLGSWILSLLEIRNICAHYGRLYNMPLKQSPYLYSEYQQYRHCKKIFPALLSLKRLLLNDELWHLFEISLESLIEQYSDVVRLSFMDFPQSWESILSDKSSF